MAEYDYTDKAEREDLMLAYVQQAGLRDMSRMETALYAALKAAQERIAELEADHTDSEKALIDSLNTSLRVEESWRNKAIAFEESTGYEYGVRWHPTPALASLGIGDYDVPYAEVDAREIAGTADYTSLIRRPKPGKWEVTDD